MLSSALSSYHGLNQDISFFPGGTGQEFLLRVNKITELIDHTCAASLQLTTLLDTGAVLKSAKLGTTTTLTNRQPGYPIYRALQTLTSYIPDLPYKSITPRLIVRLLKRQVQIFICRYNIYRKHLSRGPWIHSAAWLGCDFDGLPFLYQHCLRPTRKKNRSRLIQALTDAGFSTDRSYYLGHLLPTAYVEEFKHILRLSSNLKIDYVFSSMYGLMLDPVLALAVSLHKTCLFYVQHGGSYCTVENLHHELEAKSCQQMIYWGLGDINIRQNRFIAAPCSRLTTNQRKTESRPKLSYMASRLYSDLELDAVHRFILSIRDGTGINPTVEFCDHPHFSYNSLAKATCDKYKWKYSAGAQNMQNSNSQLVVYDSPNHTLMYERLFLGTPFLILNVDPYLAIPRFERAKIFISELHRANVFCTSYDDSYLRSIECSDIGDYGANDFFKNTMILRSLFTENPTISEVCYRLTGLSPASRPKWM